MLKTRKSESAQNGTSKKPDKNADDDDIVPTGRLYEHEPLPEEPHEDEASGGGGKAGSKKDRRVEIVWRNVLLFLALHLSAPVGLVVMLFYAKAATGFFCECPGEGSMPFE
jgi:hypothetical protein